MPFKIVEDLSIPTSISAYPQKKPKAAPAPADESPVGITRTEHAFLNGDTPR